MQDMGVAKSRIFQTNFQAQSYLIWSVGSYAALCCRRMFHTFNGFSLMLSDALRLYCEKLLFKKKVVCLAGQ